MTGPKASKTPAARPRSVAILACGVVIAGLALSNAIGNAFAKRLPAVAAVQWGADPNVAINDTFNRGDLENVGQLQGLAERSVRTQLLNSVAFAALGVAAGDRAPNTSVFFTMADRMSRRNPLAQFWLLERAVNRGDIKASLHRYDILLSLSWQYWALMFPLLDAASADPAVRHVLAPYLAHRRPWTDGYYNYVIYHSSDVGRMASTIIEAGGVDRAVTLGLDRAALFKQLYENGKYDALRSLYLSGRSAERDIVYNVSLSPASLDQRNAPIGWSFLQQPGVTIDPEGSAAAPVLRITVASGQRAVVLRKLAYVTPGRYRFAYRFGRAENAGSAGAGASATWTFRCVRSKVTLSLGGAPGQTGSHFGMLTVPNDCGALDVNLEAVGGDAQDGIAFTVADLSMLKA